MDKSVTNMLLAVFLAVTIVTLPNIVASVIKPSFLEPTNQIKTFYSQEELTDFVLAGLRRAEVNRLIEPFGPKIFKGEITTPTAASSRDLTDYSTTNVQVPGVDEADIVKSDGKSVYLASRNRFVIVEAYPAEEMKVLSSTTIKGSILGLYINRDRIVIFEGADYSPGPMSESPRPKPMPPVWVHGVHLEIYDVSDRESPRLIKEVRLNGDYVNSRMIGDYVYAIVSQPALYWAEEKPKVTLPTIGVDGEARELPATEIHYSESSDIPACYTLIVAMNTQAVGEGPKYEVVLTGYATTLYVSARDIYLTMPKGNWWSNEGSTIIHRIAIDGQRILSEANGEVPGRVLNQFSMDEHEGYLRVATTTGQVTRDRTKSGNHVYVMDAGLNIVGKLEDLAPGEQIHSARFMGDRCYLVTFKKIDPFFTIDVSNPREPRLLGKLKIPGYSDYLHPYDENYIIGIGKDTVEAKQGDFAWYRGLKVSLFDVSDVENPKEVGKLIIGDRGTESPMLRDHRAFLFTRRLNLLVIPVLEAKISQEKYPADISPNMYGDYVFQGAFVLHLDPQEGITVKGRITHVEDPQAFLKSGSYFGSNYEIKRSFYIGNVLYSVSDEIIKANNLTDLSEISQLGLAAS